MKLKTLALASIASAAVSLGAGGAAHAASLVAGWDFSQYVGEVLSVDGATFADTLDANYSDLDPTFGAGAESAAFGTMYINGQFGSFTTPKDFTDPFAPVQPSLTSNADASSLIMGSTAAFNVLTAEGQANTTDLGMATNAAVDVVFGADLTSVLSSGANWLLSFGGQALSGTASVDVEVSTDGGGSYSLLSTETLTTLDSKFSVALGAAADGLDQVFVRLGFNAGNTAKIDNLALVADVTAVPEPGTALLMVAGAIGLGVFGRRRRA